MGKVEKNKKYMSKKTKKLVIICSIMLVAIMGVTYAWLSLIIFGDNSNTIIAGTLSLKLNEKDYIDLSGDGAMPLTKESALARTDNVYNFDIENNGNIDSEYTIYLDITSENEENKIPTSAVRYMVTKNGTDSIDKLLSEAPIESLEGENKGKIVLDSSNFDANSKALKPNDKNTYTLRLWIDEAATEVIAGNIFSAKIRIVATQTDIN